MAARVSDGVKSTLQDSQGLSTFFSPLPFDDDVLIPSTRTGTETMIEWTPINGWKLVNSVVAHASARIFVGDEMGKDPDWQRLAIDCAATVSLFSRKVRRMSLFGRIWAIYFKASPEYRNWLQYKEEIYEKLRPLLEERQAASKQPDYKKPNDAIQWILDDLEASHATMTLKDQALQQLAFAFVSQVTTASASMSALYDLLAAPEYIEPLRNEIDSILDSENGRLDSATLGRMTKLDSFLIESQRLNGAMTSKIKDSNA